jgi:hypothetical protein
MGVTFFPYFSSAEKEKLFLFFRVRYVSGWEIFEWIFVKMNRFDKKFFGIPFFFWFLKIFEKKPVRKFIPEKKSWKISHFYC